MRKEERLALRRFKAGDVLKVRGLRGKPHLNGKEAVVVGFDAARRRFGCKVEGEPVALRPKNLALPGEEEEEDNGVVKQLSCV